MSVCDHEELIGFSTKPHLYRYFEILTPFNQIKVAHWNICVTFWFYNICPSIGIELNGLFFPNSSPFPELFFSLPRPMVFSQVPIKGAGCPI